MLQIVSNHNKYQCHYWCVYAVAVRLSDQDLLIVEILTELDRETTDNYVIQVIATDGGGRSSYLNLTISLEDVNEFPPVFNNSIGYVTRIKEGNYSQQYVVYTVSCCCCLYGQIIIV